MTGHLALKPGEACQPPPAVFARVLEQLSGGEMESTLTDISIYHPEAFEEALHTVAQIRGRRAQLRAGGAR
jgi:hypothetical protein